MDITIKCSSGRENSNADALSHNPMDASDQFLFPDVVALQEEQRKDPELAVMLYYYDKSARRIVVETKQHDIIDGVLHFENIAFPGHWCIVVPEQLRPDLLEEAHAGCFAAHFAEKVYDHLCQTVWWKGMMRADVRRFCRGCLVCASHKGARRTFKLPLQPIPVGGPFHRRAVDILKLPLTSNGNSYVAVFMDYLTKWPKAFAIPDQRVETIATLFIDHIVCRHGILEELLSDRGTKFLSSLIQEMSGSRCEED